MRFPENCLAHFTCSFGAADCSTYEVLGTKGILRLEQAYEMVEPIKEELTINNKTKTKTYPKKDQFAPELVYFSDCILKNKQPEPLGKEGMADVRIIRALLESAKSGRSAKVSIDGPEKRPETEQEITKPPVEKPQLVKVAASTMS